MRDARSGTWFFAVPLAVLAVVPFHWSARPISAHVKREVSRDSWQPGCPVGFSELRLLTVTYHGFDGLPHTGRLVVNQAAVAPLSRVFRRLYKLHFPIRYLSIAAAYGPVAQRPADGDISGDFECKEAIPSPCVGGTGTGSWSEHAYGMAVDLNQLENPYVGCGETRNPAARRFFDRSKHRRGMVTPDVIGAFHAIGWGWGGSWVGSTKDYTHFSASGH